MIFSTPTTLQKQMKNSEIEIQLKNYKIREGYLLKRSRVLREWRKRWIVLTINFLFSFESEDCEKVTQAIDLKEIFSFKTHLKKLEDSEPNCFYIQTKTHDFAFSTKQTNQKWSWMVTLERLFDFKERGASNYNNIDQIKTVGFSAQNQFQHMQKVAFKNRKTICSQTEKEKHQKADELLQNLIDRQEKLNKRQEALLKKQKQLEQINKASSACTEIMVKLTQRIKELEKEIAKFKGISKINYSKSMDFDVEIRNSFSEEIRVFEQNELTMQQKVLNRHKFIEYMFDEFTIAANYPELFEIVSFLIKVNSIKEGIYQESIKKCIYLHGNLKRFIQIFLTLIKKLEINNQSLKRLLLMMLLIFKDQNSIEIQYYEQAERILLDWSSRFTNLIPLQILNLTLDLLLIVVQITKGISVETAKQEASYKKKCSQILSFIRNDRDSTGSKE